MEARHHKNTIRKVQEDVKITEDIPASMATFAFDLVSGCIDYPLDAGIKRWRGCTITPANSAKDGFSADESRYLLIVRGVLENGVDVVAFCSGATWIAAVVEFNFKCSEGTLEWKPDRKAIDGKAAKTFLDTLVGLGQ